MAKVSKQDEFSKQRLHTVLLTIMVTNMSMDEKRKSKNTTRTNERLIT